MFGTRGGGHAASPPSEGSLGTTAGVLGVGVGSRKSDELVVTVVVVTSEGRGRVPVGIVVESIGDFVAGALATVVVIFTGRSAAEETVEAKSKNVTQAAINRRRSLGPVVNIVIIVIR